MDLRSPHAFWLLRNGIGDVPPALPRDRRCDVVVIGAGITGALVSDALTAAGLSVIAIDRRHPGHGSTSASTALLLYDLDASLADLTAKLGGERAVSAYHATLDGVRAIARISGEFKEDVGFRRRPTLYFASQLGDVDAFQAEYDARRHAGLPCEILDRNAIRKIVDFGAPLALWTNVGGEVDPWRLTHALFRRCGRRDFEIYGRTDVTRIVPGKSHLEVRTSRGVVQASHVVVAAGYEAERFLPERVAELQSTYAIVTEPVKKFTGWGRRCLIWESARPYLYARATTDDRIMVGGEDDPFRSAEERDARVAEKAKKLLERIRRLFPRIEMELAYGWAGTFAETKDSLPYIGAHPQGDSRVLYALAYGANGMPFSAVAAEVFTATVTGKPHRYKETFAFSR